MLKTFKDVVVFEDNARIGGFGSEVLNRINDLGVNHINLKLYGYDDAFICHGNVDELLDSLGLDVDSVAADIAKNMKET